MDQIHYSILVLLDIKAAAMSMLVSGQTGHCCGSLVHLVVLIFQCIAAANNVSGTKS